MLSINDALEELVSGWRDAEVEFAFYPQMPKIYDDDFFAQGVMVGLGNLILEVYVHSNSNRRKMKTSLEGRTQRVELAWNGPFLSEELLRKINANYQEGASERAELTRSGTRIAAQHLAMVKGKIGIENQEDGIYRVKNVVELPIEYR